MNGQSSQGSGAEAPTLQPDPQKAEASRMQGMWAYDHAQPAQSFAGAGLARTAGTYAVLGVPAGVTLTSYYDTDPRDFGVPKWEGCTGRPGAVPPGGAFGLGTIVFAGPWQPYPPQAPSC